MKEKSNIFAPYLRDDESIIWHGRALKFEDLKRGKRSDTSRQQYFSRLRGTAVWYHFQSIMVIVYIICSVVGCALPFLASAANEDFVVSNIEWLVPGYVFAVIVWIIGFFYVAAYFNGYKPHSSLNMHRSTVGLYQPWKDYRYAISNQRLFIFEDKALRHFPGTDLKDFKIWDPVDGLYNIDLFFKEKADLYSPPTAVLHHISEDDVRIVEELLTNARESNKRLHKRGI